MNSSPRRCDVDNIIVYGSDARVYVLNSALQVIWVACGGVSKLFPFLCLALAGSAKYSDTVYMPATRYYALR